ncbi:MAG: hypothetical protein ACREUI_05160, partial [Burkholderiales bacterium]
IPLLQLCSRYFTSSLLIIPLSQEVFSQPLRGARSVVGRLGQGQGIAYQMTEEAANARLTSATCNL